MLKINIINSYEDWDSQIRLLARTLKLKECVVKIMVTAGDSEAFLNSPKYCSPQTFVTVREYHQVPSSISLEPVFSVFFSPGLGIKSSNYMTNIIAAREVKKSSYVEGVMYTPEGYIAEGITSNIFFIKKDNLYTPELAIGILPGITRNNIIEIAQSNSISIQESKYTEKDLMTADAVFITNSVLGPLKVSSYKNKKFEANSVFNFISKKYDAQLINQA